jgi:hypothetical protein
VIAAPGVRSDSGTSLRSALVSAVSMTLGDRALWLLGAMGFAVRGGAVLLILPIVTIPSPVMLSIIFRGDISTSGVSSEAAVQAAVAAIAVGALVVAAILIAAYGDIETFARMAGDAHTADIRMGTPPREVDARERRGLLLRLAAIYAVGLLPILVVLGFVGQRIGSAIVDELQFPTDVQNSLVVNILHRVQTDLLVLIAVILVVDVLVTLASRQVLAARFNVLPARRVSPGTVDRPHHDVRDAVRGLGRVVLQAPRTLLTAVLCWCVTAVTLVPVLLAIIGGWTLIRSLLFAQVPPDPLQQAMLVCAQAVAVLGFGVIWVASITLMGISSSLRAALWTTNAMRP